MWWVRRCVTPRNPFSINLDKIGKVDTFKNIDLKNRHFLQINGKVDTFLSIPLTEFSIREALRNDIVTLFVVFFIYSISSFFFT